MRGTLVLVVGPSGAGKDSLIAFARSRLRPEEGVIFPRRIITRQADGGSEDHDTVTESAFSAAVVAGRFALHWRAHGLGYGIPAAIGADIAAGRSVVVNVSRSAIEAARARFQPVAVVLVTAPAEVLRERLRHRGRESEADIAGRLERAGEYRVEGPDVIVLDNSGPVAVAGEAFLRFLRRTREPA